MVARGLLFTLAILTVSLAFTTSYAQAALSVGNPSASATLVDSGTPVSISSSGASGGTSPYTYTWYEQTPGGGGFYPSRDCSSSTTNCVFGAYGSGTYYFQLQAVDSGNPQQTSKSQTVGITVEPALEATISTANGTIYPGQYDDINVKTSGGVLPYNYQWLGGTVSGDCAAPPVEGTTQGYLTFTPTASEAGCDFEFRAIVTDSAQGSQPITVESTIYVLQLPQNTTTGSSSGGSGSGGGGGSGSSGGSHPGGAIITKNGGQITVSNLSGTPVAVEFEGANISLRNGYSTSTFGHITVNNSYYQLNIGQAVQIETTPSVMMKLVATKSVQGIYNDQVLLYEGTVAVNSTTSAGSTGTGSGGSQTVTPSGGNSGTSSSGSKSGSSNSSSGGGSFLSYFIYIIIIVVVIIGVLILRTWLRDREEAKAVPSENSNIVTADDAGKDEDKPTKTVVK